MKLLKESTENTLVHWGRQWPFERPQKHRQQMLQVGKWIYIKLSSFCKAKERNKTQETFEWVEENICSIHSTQN